MLVWQAQHSRLVLPPRSVCVPLPAQQPKQGLGVQGAKDEEASTFYVLEIGNCDVFVSSPASGGQPAKVHAYTSGR